MTKSAEIVILVIFALQAAAIITGNMFTIFVFWTQRTHLKRACFLLINLALADLLVGIAEPIVIATEKLPRIKETGPMEDGETMKTPSSAFQVLGSSTSVIFLAFISLERAHAVLRPLRHRVASTSVYICAIVVAWTAGLGIALENVLAMYLPEVDTVYGTVTVHSFIFVCVLFICASYLTVHTRLHYSRSPLEIEIHNRRSTEQNLRLSRTFFIVAAVSLVFWLPAVVVYVIREFCHIGCYPAILVMLVNCLHLANSMINPIVYCIRMPIFKSTLKKCCGRLVENIESRPVVFNVKNEAVEFGTHL